MNARSEVSGPLGTSFMPEWPSTSAPKFAPFLGNSAKGIPQPASVLIGRRESSVPVEYSSEPFGIREAAQRELYLHDAPSRDRSLLDAGCKNFEDDVQLLRSQYVFRNESVIKRFLVGHRNVVPTLSTAVCRLKESFGQNIIPTLEATFEDDESISLYGIAIWRGSAADAELALEDFDRRWWLNQPPYPRLTFTYELA